MAIKRINNEKDHPNEDSVRGLLVFAFLVLIVPDF